MNIKSSAGRASLQRGRWMLHGPGKIGKSTCASGWPNNLFLATERRLDHIEGVQYTFIDSWLAFKEVVKELGASTYKKKYEVVTVDVIDHIWHYCIEHVCKRLGIEHQSDEGYGKAWDAVDKEFKSPFFKLLSYPYGLIFISHTQNEEIQSLRGTQTKFTLGLPKRARRIVVPYMGVIGYIDHDDFKIKKDGKTKILHGRSIRFEGDDNVEAADGEGYLPDRVRLYKDASKTYELIKSYYDESGSEG